MVFIRNQTKVKGILACILGVMALSILILLSTFLDMPLSNKINFMLIYTLCSLLVILPFKGLIELQVFKDYRFKNKLICAQAIIDICLPVLIFVTGILFATVTSKIDLRIYLVILISMYFIWQVVQTIISYKQKRFNSWVQLIMSVLLLSVVIIVSIGIVNWLPLIQFLLVISTWLFILFNLFNVLFSYIIKQPDYLQTQEAVDEMALESDELQLKRLKELYEEDIITNYEYNTKKKEIINRMFGRN